MLSLGFLETRLLDGNETSLLLPKTGPTRLNKQIKRTPSPAWEDPAGAEISLQDGCLRRAPSSAGPHAAEARVWFKGEDPFLSDFPGLRLVETRGFWKLGPQLLLSHRLWPENEMSTLLSLEATRFFSLAHSLCAHKLGGHERPGPRRLGPQQAAPVPERRLPPVGRYPPRKLSLL